MSVSLCKMDNYRLKDGERRAPNKVIEISFQPAPLARIKRVYMDSDFLQNYIKI